jgi:hypothetical protein
MSLMMKHKDLCWLKSFGRGSWWLFFLLECPRKWNYRFRWSNGDTYQETCSISNNYRINIIPNSWRLNYWRKEGNEKVHVIIKPPGKPHNDNLHVIYGRCSWIFQFVFWLYMHIVCNFFLNYILHCSIRVNNELIFHCKSLSTNT